MTTKSHARQTFIHSAKGTPFWGHRIEASTRVVHLRQWVKAGIRTRDLVISDFQVQPHDCLPIVGSFDGWCPHRHTHPETLHRITCSQNGKWHCCRTHHTTKQATIHSRGEGSKIKPDQGANQITFLTPVWCKLRIAYHFCASQVTFFLLSSNFTEH